MSQRDFMTAISRLSFHASTLAARGGEYVALAQINQLVDHFDALVTYPSASSFSPYQSPIVDDGMPFWGTFDTAPPAIAPAPTTPRATRKQTGFYFDTPHTLDHPPPVPSLHDQTRTDRGHRYAYPASNPKEGFNVRRNSARANSHSSTNHKDAV